MIARVIIKKEYKVKNALIALDLDLFNPDVALQRMGVGRYY